MDVVQGLYCCASHHTAAACSLSCRAGATERRPAHSTDLCAQRRTFLLYSPRFCTYSEAASGLAGEEQLGSVSRLCMEVRMVETLWQGDHWSWMMSRQMLPSLQQQAHHRQPRAQANPEL